MGANRATDRSQHRLSLPSARRYKREHRGSKESGDGQSVSVGWNFLECPEAAIGELLLAARIVESNHFHGDGVEKVGRVWIVKGEVAVVADPTTDEVDRLRFDESGVIKTNLKRVVSALAGDEVESILRDVGQSKKPLLEVAAS